MVEETLKETEEREDEIAELMVNYFNRQKKPHGLLTEWHLSKKSNILLAIWKNYVNNTLFFIINKPYRDQSGFHFHAISLSKRQLLVLRDVIETALAEYQKLEIENQSK